MYKLKKHFRKSIILMIVSLIVMSNNVFAAESTLSISPIQQQTDAWCWAATAEMNGKYYYNYKTGSSSARDQSDVVEHIAGWADPDRGGTIIDVCDGSEFVCYDEYFGVRGTWTYTYSEVKTIINNAVPLAVGVVSATIGHAVLIKGYKDAGFLTSDRLVYNDPWTGQAYTENFTSFYDGPLGSATWTYTMRFTY